MEEFNIELDYDGSFTISEYLESKNNTYVYPTNWPEQYGFNKNALLLKDMKITDNKITCKLTEISGFGYTTEFKKKFTLNLVTHKGKLVNIVSVQNIPTIRIKKFFKIVNPKLLIKSLF